MIANITTIMYILSVSDESINNGILQKGTAISRIDDEDAFQIYKYYNYLTSQNDTDSDLNDEYEVKSPLKVENVYLITGKFSTAQDNSINVSITTNVDLSIEKEDIPIIKPTVQLLGKTLGYAELTESGYTLQIQVKPYLSKEQFTPFTINLTHPPNGRFKNALTKAKKNSTVHTTGMFFFAENQLYCEILEFQFISAKIESDNSIVVPWKSKTNSHTERSSKSAIEQRIALVQQNLATQPPSSTKPLISAKNKRKTNMTKIADISRSLLLQNQQGDEIHDSEISITNEENGERIDENTDEDEERFENIEEKNNAKISDSTRSKKKQKTK
jgi:hypothetical protein